MAALLQIQLPAHVPGKAVENDSYARVTASDVGELEDVPDFRLWPGPDPVTVVIWRANQQVEGHCCSISLSLCLSDE